MNRLTGLSFPIVCASDMMSASTSDSRGKARIFAKNCQAPRWAPDIVSWGGQPQNYGGPQVHTKFKLITRNSNSSHQIQIDHTEFKFVTPNSNSSHGI